MLRVNIARLRQKVEPEPSTPRYVITRPEAGSGKSRGETFVDTTNGGIGGFKPSLIPKENILSLRLPTGLTVSREDYENLVLIDATKIAEEFAHAFDRIRAKN